MTDHAKSPERVWVDFHRKDKKRDPRDKGTGSYVGDASDGQTEDDAEVYIHENVSEAMIAAELERAAHTAYVTCAETRHVRLGNHVAATIRDLITADQSAALERMKSEALREGIQRAWRILDRSPDDLHKVVNSFKEEIAALQSNDMTFGDPKDMSESDLDFFGLETNNKKHI